MRLETLASNPWQTIEVDLWRRHRVGTSLLGKVTSVAGYIRLVLFLGGWNRCIFLLLLIPPGFSESCSVLGTPVLGTNTWLAVLSSRGTKVHILPTGLHAVYGGRYDIPTYRGHNKIPPGTHEEVPRMPWDEARFQ
jgi:hypothetical protein